MMTRAAPVLVLLLGVCLCPPIVVADQVYLVAEFNDKEIDQPIGQGGPDVGEPIEVYTSTISAIVREGPMGSPSLEIRDTADFGSGFAIFEFLGGAELTTGIVNVSADLWFHEIGAGNRFLFYVRERETASERFGDLRFHQDGSITLIDEQGYVGAIGNYEVGRRFRVITEFDMDAGTYDVWLDGVLAVNGRAHGIAGRGIGSVILGCDHDEDLEGFFNVDALNVTDYFQEVPVTEQSWGRIKISFGRSVGGSPSSE
jgi:hypothetical protein